MNKTLVRNVGRVTLRLVRLLYVCVELRRKLC